MAKLAKSGKPKETEGTYSDSMELLSNFFLAVVDTSKVECACI